MKARVTVLVRLLPFLGNFSTSGSCMSTNYNHHPESNYNREYLNLKAGKIKLLYLQI